MKIKRFYVIAFCFIVGTAPTLAKEPMKTRSKNGLVRHRNISKMMKFLSILGLSFIAPSSGGVVKKRRSTPFRPTPKDECKVLGEKKQISYFIDPKEGCTQPGDKANLIGPSIASYIADLSSKWQTTEFIEVGDREQADFTIILGNSRNSESCPTTSYWSQSKKEMALGDIASYGLTLRKQKRRTVLHEFGHVLGISHEHIHPDFPYTLDFDAIESDPNNPGIHNYLPTTPAKSFLTDYNIKSIMHYKLDKKETEEGKRFKLNYLLSDGDHISELIAMPPCGLSSDEAFAIFLNLKESLSKTQTTITPQLLCEELFSSLGVDSSGRCEFPKDHYLPLSNYAIIGMSSAGGVLILWCAKRSCCKNTQNKEQKEEVEEPRSSTQSGEDLV